jgi:hypothetical protein
MFQPRNQREHNVAEYFFTADQNDGSRLYISPLSDRIFAAAESEFQENIGHFLYRRNDLSNQDDISIIAQLSSEESVFSLSRLLKME